MTSESRALHWLGGVMDAAGSHSWIHRAAKPDTAALRLFLIHRDPEFLALVRRAARCGTITRRRGGGWQWTVEGARAVDLAGELIPHMHAPFPRTEDEQRPGPADAGEREEPAAWPADATLLPREVGERLGLSRAWVTRLAERHGIGAHLGTGRRSTWRFSPADVERLRALLGKAAPDAG